jgi:enoyl-CoA hydratase/carnithine racemase
MELSPARVALPTSLDGPSVAALARALADALASPAPVVALTGASDTTFCLGLAIGAGTAGDDATGAFADLLTTLHLAPKPLLAIVDGQAIGGGLGLACACDWIVATERAVFALPELLWGLVPAIIWPVVTARLAPPIARRWTLSAHTRTAAEGAAAGLVDELVPTAQLPRGVARATRTLARLDAEALRRLRSWARASTLLDVPAALHAGAGITAEMLARPVVRDRWLAFERGEAPWSA